MTTATVAAGLLAGLVATDAVSPAGKSSLLHDIVCASDVRY